MSFRKPLRSAGNFVHSQYGRKARYRNIWLGGVAAAALIGSMAGPAFAQQTQNDTSNRPLEEIQITGSRIISSGMTTPTPVTSVQASELQNMSPGNLIESLSELPQFFSNQTPDQVNGGQNSGGSNLNLRGAGTNRTLVLLDGRRVVPSNRFGTVDVGIFPKELIKNVETVTGGASASYGTDAVAGVVNFILDTDFTGVKGHLQGGETQYADGKTWEGGLAFGTGIGEKFHIIGSLEMSRQQPVDTFKSLEQRKWIKQTAQVTNPAYVAGDPSSGPMRLLRNYVSPTNFTYGGVLLDAKYPDSPLNHLEFQPDGSLAKMPFSGVGQMTGGCNCQAEDQQSWGVNKDGDLYPGLQRSSAFLHMKYDFTDNFEVYLQGVYGHNRIDDRRESISLLQSWQTNVGIDNYYLPQAVKDQMANEGLTSIGFGMLGFNGPDTPLGDARQITINNLYQGTIGFKSQFKTGGFLDGWHLDGYYQYGQNHQAFDEQNGIRVDRVPLAMDVVADANGNPVCYAKTIDPQHFGDCVPMNLFGGVQNISQAAANYITDDYKHAIQKVKQHVAEVVLTGDIWDGFGAGPISGAVGANYRKETLDQSTPDPTDEFPALPDGTLLSDIGLLPPDVRGLIPQDKPGGIPGVRYVSPGFTGDSNSSAVLFSSLRTIKGSSNVKEAFGELNIPLLANLPFAQSLTGSLAARYADYSGSGGIWAWKAGLDWQMITDLRFRGTLSRDVRAATLRERFDQTRGGTNVTDPENGGAGISAASLSGGNEAVAPEKADTITIGTVFQPTFLDGFSASLDWYRINIKGAIAQLSSQDIVDGCHNGDQTLCQYVHRNPATNLIDRIDMLFINLANQRISGVDLETSYRTGLTLLGGGAESVSWRFFGSYLAENSIKNPGAARDERAGQYDYPEWKFTTTFSYMNGPWTAFLTERWTDGGKLNRLYVEGVDIDNNHVKSSYFTDVHLGYAFGESQQWSVYADMTNVFDQDARLTPGSAIGRTGVGNTVSPASDVLGRRFVIGARFQY
jgi:outer membrane receptor protein involved in Fe transport